MRCPALTDVCPAQGITQWPRPQVHDFAIDQQRLQAAPEAVAGPCHLRQPVHSGGATHKEGCAEGDLGVLSLRETGGLGRHREPASAPQSGLDSPKGYFETGCLLKPLQNPVIYL